MNIGLVRGRVEKRVENGLGIRSSTADVLAITAPASRVALRRRVVVKHPVTDLAAGNGRNPHANAPVLRLLDVGPMLRLPHDGGVALEAREGS